MNCNLFAFSNKVFDCKPKEFRNIEPNECIMTNTAYGYDQIILNISMKKVEF